MIPFLAMSLLASAADPASSAPMVSPPTKEKLICRDDAETGSLITKTTCHTKAQWQEIYKSGQLGVDAFRNRPMQGFQKGG